MSQAMEDRSAALADDLLRGLRAAGHRDAVVAVTDAGGQIWAMENRKIIGRWKWDDPPAASMPVVEK